MTELARVGRLDPLVGRDAVIERIVQVLSGHQVQDAQALGDAFLAPSRVNSAHQLREMHAGERVPHCRGATAP